MAESQASESTGVSAFKQAFEEGLRAWNEGDVERAYATLPDDVDYRLVNIWPQARPLKGRDEVVAFFEDLQETFPDAGVSSAELIEVDERTVVAGFRVTGSGRSSGAGASMEIWQVWELRERVVPTRVTEFEDREAALKAAGARSAAQRGGQ
jgi:ketosteroid isomerase-like protein